LGSDLNAEEEEGKSEQRRVSLPSVHEGRAILHGLTYSRWACDLKFTKLPLIIHYRSLTEVGSGRRRDSNIPPDMSGVSLVAEEGLEPPTRGL
jgi:hypothetical protein